MMNFNVCFSFLIAGIAFLVLSIFLMDFKRKKIIRAIENSDFADHYKTWFSEQPIVIRTMRNYSTEKYIKLLQRENRISNKDFEYHRYNRYKQYYYLSVFLLLVFGLSSNQFCA